MPPKYRDGETDADGNNYLDDSGVTDGFYYDATQDPWHLATGADFCGAGRDGYYYWNGTQCASGGLGTATAFGSPNDSVLTLPAPHDPYGGTWDANGSTTVNSATSVSFESTGGDGAVWLAYTTAGAVWSNWRWVIPGSTAFDIQIDFSDFLCEDAYRRRARLVFECFHSDHDYFRISRYRDVSGSSEQYQRIYRTAGGVQQLANEATAGAGDGKLRIVKAQDGSNSTYTGYFWTGDWNVIVGAQSGLGTGLAWAYPVYIRVFLEVTSLQEAGGCSASVTASNFTINTGSTQPRPGWALEASGSERGSRADFPEKSVITTTDTSVSIIDIDNDKLWMRFLQGTSPSDNLLGDRYYDESGGSPKPRRVHMRNGILTIAQGETDAAQNNGGHVVIDFNTDTARVHRSAASDFTGGVYGGTGGTKLYLYRAGGTIFERNSDRNWTYDEVTWPVPDNRLQATSQYRSGSYDYRASATYSGISVQKLETYSAVYDTNTDWATGNIDTWYEACAFDQYNGDLYYLDSTNVYWTPQSTWDAAMGGSTWTADSVRTRPGTVSVAGQDCIVAVDGEAYLIADEGVYKSVAGGAYTLEYGESGSGATYEILSAYDRISAIGLVTSGTNNALVCNLSIDAPTSYTLELIDLTINVMTSSTDITDYMDSEPLRVSG